jgi:hypothetical protein
MDANRTIDMKSHEYRIGGSKAMSLKTSMLVLLVIAVASCGLVSADTTTSVQGTLGASFAIAGLDSAQSLPTGVINTLVVSTLDTFTVDANAAWSIQVYGANLVSDDSTSDTATNALKLYCSADGTDPSTSVNLPTASDTTSEFSGDAGTSLPKGIKFGQQFTYADSPNANGKKYSSTVTLAIAAS